MKELSHELNGLHGLSLDAHPQMWMEICTFTLQLNLAVGGNYYESDVEYACIGNGFVD